ncbi:phosphonate transport system substrate-binding protein [Saccharopolyspora antimicrobica]|uniref:Phosphonate transport system substrate-binding protein n=1 Tax=Saccharopolyspora antimicrobica TaxID=455193 RepID=A0A1I5AF89_9PSEU|nr:phosphate/phosphite/phosphonate ABC transporter substrate-binding protein [Saccharopolyspora antimicrobica]RKT83166.1 phosphonate transport system substrate-binding protein [Saccharopolyspora antimicrobica]SFN60869.1 phosphonate transport system substrate-binding protein [Saccharopolyspora antimicrobica]
MLNVSRRLLAVLACAALPLGLAACGPSAASDTGARNPDELVFASIPSEESTSLEQEFKPLVDLLAAETGKKIRVEKATDYAAVIEGQRTGKIDIAMYGPLSYVVARNSGVRVTPVGAQVETPGSVPGYRAYGLVRADSPIQRIEEFGGKQVCFVDPNSTSGYLYPKAALRTAGVDVERDVRPVMAGGHDASALAVQSRQCDAGFAYDTMVDKLLPEKGNLQPGALRVVWRSEVIPGSPAAISDDLDPALKEKVVQAFRTKANADYLKANGFCTDDCEIGGYWGFAPADDATFDSVRQVCEVTRAKQCTES